MNKKSSNGRRPKFAISKNDTAIRRCHEYAKNNGMKCLSMRYSDVLEWKCQCGMIFWASFSDIQQDDRCQACKMAAFIRSMLLCQVATA